VALLTKAGLRQIRFHDLHHTFASLLLQQGESLAFVKEQIGHHSIQVTVDIYGHLIAGSNKQLSTVSTRTPLRLLPEPSKEARSPHKSPRNGKGRV